MYELNRVRLAGIGPRGARYTDVTLDLSGVGPPVGSATLHGSPARRPSPVALLMLENGGGKTVLLKLLFSVVLPGRSKVVGGRAASLDPFVLETDTGHVALEWMHPVTGDRVITAKVLQRRARAAAGASPLIEAWYSLRPGPQVSLDTLPISDAGRRRRIEGYKQTLAELDEAHAAIQLNWMAEEPGAWTRHLRELGLEPDLFDIQRSMNVDEGDAGNAFTFRTSADFIDWVLKTVTDPADPIAVADTFDKWAATLAERETMVLERDFLDGAIAGLEVLSDAHTAAAETAAQATAARHAARRLESAIGARRDQEQHAAGELDRQLTVTRTELTSRTTDRDRARDLTNEVRRQTLLLQQTETQVELEQTRQELANQQQLHEAWQLVPKVAESAKADARAQHTAQLLAGADSEAAPALRARDEAAGQLLSAYTAAATQADQAADESEAKASQLDADAGRAGEERDTALVEKEQADERARTARTTIAATEKKLLAAAEAELIPPSTPVGAVPALLADAQREHEGRASQLTAATTECERLAAMVAVAVTLERQLRDKRQTTAAEESEARRQLEGAERSAARLAAVPVIADAAGAVPDEPLAIDELDEHADTLIDTLGTAIASHQQHVNDLGVAQREDERVLQALGDGGLLPARPDVNTAIGKLNAARIPAHPGWRYLRDNAHADERAALISAHPSLADGIILTNPAQLPDARTVLEDARLLPAAAIEVGSGAVLLTLPGDVGNDMPAPTGFVIEPTPALYDSEAAEQRRQQLSDQLNERAAIVAETEKQAGALRTAQADLRSWRAVNPPGHLAALRQQHVAARERVTEIGGQHDGAEARLASLQQEHKDAVAAVETARQAERDASDHVTALIGLADADAAAIAATKSLEPLTEISRDREQRAAAAARRRRDAEKSATDQRLAASSRREVAARMRANMAEVESTTGVPVGNVPKRSIPELRANYAAAQSSYLTAAPDAELKATADSAAADAKKLRDALGLTDPGHLRTARTLLVGPDGADRAAWERAVTAVRARCAELTTHRATLDRAAGRLEQAISEASPKEAGRLTWIQLPSEWRPISVSHGETLAAQAAAGQHTAQEALDAITAQITTLSARLHAAEQHAAGFDMAFQPLTAVLDSAAAAAEPPVAEPPFAGSSADAKGLAQQVLRQLKDTSAAEKEAQRAETHAYTELAEFARQDQYNKMRSAARTALLDSPAQTVAAQAHTWAGQLLARRTSLQTDLDAVTRHRATIVERLATLVDQALRTVRTAARLSRLPATLGDWAGKEFLHIQFTPPDAAMIAIRVGDLIDTLAPQTAQRNQTRGTPARVTRRDGFALLLQAVHAAVPRGFAVTILKPDSILRDEAVPVEGMREVFSGGQELTAAIMLYCTLAALKANERGQMRSRHSGVLFLDNPIGKANARYLLDMQTMVASALGVQLVYTTGLADDRALAAFPLWIRLRNDADLRVGLKHIRVAQQVRRLLPASFEDGDASDQAGTITASRLYLRSAAHGASA
jgi:hypothetical protein